MNTNDITKKPDFTLDINLHFIGCYVCGASCKNLRGLNVHRRTHKLKPLKSLRGYKDTLQVWSTR